MSLSGRPTDQTLVKLKADFRVLRLPIRRFSLLIAIAAIRGGGGGRQTVVVLFSSEKGRRRIVKGERKARGHLGTTLGRKQGKTEPGQTLLRFRSQSCRWRLYAYPGVRPSIKLSPISVHGLSRRFPSRTAILSLAPARLILSLWHFTKTAEILNLVRCPYFGRHVRKVRM